MMLGATGYAHNLAGGDVEVWVEGGAQAVEELCAWLWQGPPASQVTNVVCEERPPTGYRDFTTG
jgi:acylphosphatase